MKTTTYLLSAAAVSSMLLLGGCASQAEMMMQQGYGPAYSQGYQDGCDSGRKAGGSMFDQFKKNVRRYDSEYKYREGWDDGYRQCKSEEKEMLHNIENAQRTQAEQQIADELHNKRY